MLQPLNNMYGHQWWTHQLSGCHGHALWESAMREELESLMTNQTWSLTSLLAGCKAILCKWVYKVKLFADGTIDKYKAHLVARGFTQCPDLDFKENFSPVIKHDSVWALLALIATHKLHYIQYDIKTAFLNGDLDELIFMTQPKGYIDPDHPCWVYRLKKSIYGLKQAAR